jgi:UbiD family decarboxylase
MVHAIENPTKPVEVDQAPCQEIVEQEVDLDRLPILFHCVGDGGNYISSGVFITKSREGIQNVDFHRAMQIGRDRFSLRIVKQRDFDTLLGRDATLPVAVCIGNPANVLLAAATSVPLGLNELEIANTLEPLRVTRPTTFDGQIPADCEFVLEGVVRLDERAPEGPFVDLTGTYDMVRQEPVFEVTHITHRKDALWQALLPAGRDHQMLMGMPREPTILKEVERAGVKCLDVNVNPGGCSWLHAIIRIEKKREDDGKRAIEAGFRGHKSCKHVFVVDNDIDIYNPLDVEWAMATRFQADVDLIVKEQEKGSSLDPSADPETSFTVKCGFDCTKPLNVRSADFERVVFPKIDLKKVLE